MLISTEQRVKANGNVSIFADCLVINEGAARIGNLTRAKFRRVCRSTYMSVCQNAWLFHLGDVEIFHRVS